MYWVYSALLLLAILLTLPLWWFRWLTTPKYRETVRERLGMGEPLPPAPTPLLWLHAVSVGELKTAVGLVTAWRAQHPDHRWAVSTVTKTGRQMAEEHLPFAHRFFYLPIDLPWIVERVTARVTPRLLLVMETELWPNLFRSLGRRGIPIAIVNGRLSERSFRRYRRVAPFMKLALSPVRLFAMQSEADAERIRRIGADPARVRVTGNLKFEAAWQLPDAVSLALLADRLPPPADPVWLAASTHPGEEELVIEAWSRLLVEFPALRLVLVPRHPERASEVADLLRERGLTWLSFSQARGRWEERVLLVDQVGWLGRLYSWRPVVFVGGSLVPRGGQNPLEPAAWGVAPIFGPHTFHFTAITDQLVAAGGALAIPGAEGLVPAVGELLRDPAERSARGERARAMVAAGQGALARTLEAVQTLWNESSHGPE